jgi:myosin heavy subunit
LTVTKDFTTSEVRQEKFFGASVLLWCAFAGGACLMMLFINFGMLRPIHRQLERLESRVGGLQQAVHKIAGQTGGVEETNSLLGLLAAQQNELAAATGVLEELVELKQGLIDGEEKVVKAQHCLNEVAGLAKGLIAQQELPGVGHEVLEEMDKMRSTLQDLQQKSRQTNARLESLARLSGQLGSQRETMEAAKDALDALVELKDRALSQADDLHATEEVITRADKLHQRLAESTASASAASEASESLLTLQADLISHAGGNKPAQTALDGLLDVQEQLKSTSEIEVARAHVDALLELKNRVLAQADDLPGAIETLEVTDELHQQFKEAAVVIRGMQANVIAILMLKPSFEQAMQVLNTMTGLVNLRRLDGNDLRQVASSALQQRRDRLANNGLASNVEETQDPHDDLSLSDGGVPVAVAKERVRN